MTKRTVTEVEANEIAYEAYRLSEYLKKNPTAQTAQDVVMAMQAMGQMNTLFIEALILSLLGSLKPVHVH